MSNFDQSWRDHAPKRTRLGDRAIGYVAAVLLFYGGVDALQTLNERVIAEEQQIATERAYAQTLRDCMSGAVGFYFPDTKKAYECKVMPL